MGLMGGGVWKMKRAPFEDFPGSPVANILHFKRRELVES